MDCHVEWPPIDPGVLSHLRILYPSPLQLDAAFDGEEDCTALVACGFPAMVEELRVDTVAQLMLWKWDNERPLKRLRSCVAARQLFKLPTLDNLTVQGEYQRLTKTSVLCVLEMHTKRKHKKYKEDPPDIRSQRFEMLRKKYSLLLAQVMINADLPVVSLINSLEDPKASWVHLFAARRGNTLKNRYKVWKPFERWLETHRSCLFPRDVKDAIDYLQHRVNEGCGKTIPESLATTLGMLEQLGRVIEGNRISDDPVWKGHIKSWAAELASESAPRKPAEMYTVAMVISLELTVVENHLPAFQRALAWVVLCMVWGAMRCDDVQAVLPHRSSLSNYGLRLVLGKTKTTGPDKMQKEVAAFVYRTISLSGEDWLRAGFEIWESDEFRFRRDYLVMEPTSDWRKVRRKFLTPAGLSSEISKLLSMLAVPRRVALGWELMPHALLLPDGLETFFSGHSPRNFLTSIAAAIGFSRDERAFLGRWTMGMTSSEEYVRTSRQVVHKIQRAVNRSLVEGFEEPYFEDEAIQKLCDTAEAAGANPNRIKKRHAVLSNWSGRNSLGGIFPTLEVFDDDVQDQDESQEAQAALAESVAKICEKDAAVAEKVTKYFITISRRSALRRLHLTGCFVKPDRCCEVLFVDEISSDDFDSICQACKRKMLLECGRDDGGDSSSTASSSSTVSGGDPDEVPLRESVKQS